MNDPPLQDKFFLATQQDDITFWSERLCDHSILLYVLLDSERAEDLKIRAYHELEKWKQQLQTPNPYLLNQLIYGLSSLKHQILRRTESGQINLMLSSQDFQKLVIHMIEELDFFVSLLNSTMTPEKEFSFWIRESVEHTELSAHLLPPGHFQKDSLQVAERLKLLTNGKNINQLLNTYRLANQIALNLYNIFQKSPGLVNNLDCIMLEHEIKEGLRGQKRINEILGVFGHQM